jgi:hypothetical protein
MQEDEEEEEKEEEERKKIPLSFTTDLMGWSESDGRVAEKGGKEGRTREFISFVHS